MYKIQSKIIVSSLDLSASASSEDEDCEVKAPKQKNTINSNKEVQSTNDGVIVDCVALVHLPDNSPTGSLEPIRHSSPYYYGDLFNKTSEPSSSKTVPSNYRKSISLDVPGKQRSRTPGITKRNSLADDGSPSRFDYSQAQDLLSPTSGSEHGVLEKNDILSSCIITEWDHTLPPPHRLLNYDLPGNFI